MEAPNEMNRLKIEMVMSILAMQDLALLQRIKGAMDSSLPLPEALREGILQGQKEAKAGLGKPVEEFLDEIQQL